MVQSNCIQSYGGSDASTTAHVLIVEDDRDVRQSLAEYLRLRGNHVTEARSGLDFYRLTREAHFDVAILDINLPDCDGFELAGALRRDIAPTGIVMLTARDGRDDRVRGYAEGTDLYLTKPVDSEELALAVRNLARRLQGQAEPASEGWQLDRIGYRLTAPDDVSLDLTGREMQFLHLLAEAKGQPVSRATLSAALGYDERPEARGLDAILQRLKLKAAAAGMELPIKTIRTIGISFAAAITLS